MSDVDFPNLSQYRVRWPAGLEKNIANSLRTILSQEYFKSGDSFYFPFDKTILDIENLLTIEGIQLVNAFWHSLNGLQPYNYICWLFNSSKKDYLLIAPEISEFVQKIAQTSNVPNQNKAATLYYFNNQDRTKDRCWGYCSTVCNKSATDWKQYLSEFNLEMLAQAYAGWTPSIVTAFSNIAKSDPKWVLSQLLPLTQKGKEYQIREAAYEALTYSGLLDLELAENLRKESSMTVAATSARALLYSSNNYSNFDELVKELLKCRHREVAVALAQSLPEDKLPFLMGNPHPEVQEIIHERMLK